jgi:hypothetical protein
MLLAACLTVTWLLAVFVICLRYCWLPAYLPAWILLAVFNCLPA